MNNLQALRVAVLEGGFSGEREVSLVTGAAVAAALAGQVAEVIEIDLGQNVVERLEAASPDVVFVALHGPFGEDGTVQGLLELLGYRYTGSGVLASALAMDKSFSKRLFQYHRIPTPDFAVIEWDGRGEPPALPTGLQELPLVVKPAASGSTIGVTIVQHPEQFPEACRHACQPGRRILIESYVPGAEITVGILDETPLPVIEIVPAEGFYDYQAKYHSAGKTEYLIPARLPAETYRRAQELALQSHRALDCRHFSRVDMRLDLEGRLHVLEVNTIPGLTPQSLLPKAAAFVGIDFAQLVASMIRLALKDAPARLAGGGRP